MVKEMVKIVRTNGTDAFFLCGTCSFEHKHSSQTKTFGHFCIMDRTHTKTTRKSQTCIALCYFILVVHAVYKPSCLNGERKETGLSKTSTKTKENYDP